MNSFIKVFAASLLALFVFVVVGFFILMAIFSSLASASRPETGEKAVLLIDLDDAIRNPPDACPITEADNHVLEFNVTALAN